MHNSVILGLVIVLAFAFDFTNGFHDTANSVAPTIATTALPPRIAVGLSAVLNLVGAFLSLKIAAAIASGIVDQTHVTLAVVFAGLAGAICWNLTTWYFTLPSSSSHALIGGVIGATIASSGSSGVLWHGVVSKVVVPGVLAPLIALLLAGIATRLCRGLLAGTGVQERGIGLRIAQIGASSLQSIAHGTNDAQKTMGVLTLALIANGTIAADAATPSWVVITCALAMGLGTFIGGWRIIRTMGHGFTELDPVAGLSAQLSSSVTILTSSHFGLPLSTTYVATGSVIGTGVATKGRAVRWGLAGRAGIAWLITLPVAGLVGAIAYGVEAVLGATFGAVVLGGVVAMYSGTLFLLAGRNPVTSSNVNEPWSSELGLEP
ncbi:MAG: inorganic phosphate transporter, partial [Actinomycetota bacterium]